MTEHIEPDEFDASITYALDRGWLLAPQVHGGIENGTSWLVLVAAGGMVTAVLGVIAGFGPPGPALAAQILLLVVVALVVLAAAAAVASRRVGQRRDAR